MIQAVTNAATEEVDGVAVHATDKTIVDNKSAVSQYCYDNDINLTDINLAAVTDDTATVTTAIAAVDAASIDGTTFMLTTGLADLEAANSALTAFLVTADGDDDATTTATTTSVTAAQTAAVTAVDNLVTGDYTTASTNVRAALLSDQQTVNATALTTANTALTTATANVAAVSGLSAAIATLNSANDAVTAATAAVSSTSTIVATLTGALAAYNTANTSAVTVAANGTVTGLIVENATTGLLELATGITETTNPGITALLNASQAKETGDEALVDATAAAASALEVVNNLDLNTAATTAIEAVGAGMTVVTPADAQVTTDTTAVTTAATNLATAVTNADVVVLATGGTVDAGTIVMADDGTATATVDSGTPITLLQLNATTGAVEIGAGLVADAGGLVAALIAASQAKEDADADLVVSTAAAALTQADLDAATTADDAADAAVTAATTADTAADTAVTDFAALVATYTAAAAATNPLTTALATAEAGVETAQDDIDDLAEAVADLDAATALVTEMTELQDAITAAQDAFTDNDFAAPVTLTTGTNYATAADDIFLIDDAVATSTIANFNLLGADTLYIGTDFTFNDGVLADDGDNAVLEVFLSEVAGNAVITMESEVFSSNSTDAEVVITLTGVDMADVTIANGFVTVA